jgi:hypothetical protein
VKNRMLEIGTYGSVRGGGRNILTYSDQDAKLTMVVPPSCGAPIPVP